MISATASGQGKTSITAALARFHSRQGKRVRVFKCGPDFIDPMVLERASGAPAYQLDLWMCGEAHCRELLHNAAREVDLILVEGMMGLYDGEPSSADLAVALGLPVVAVIDAGAMAQTFGALALGLAQYREDVTMAGVIANRVGSAGHARMLAASLPAALPLLAAFPKNPALSLPERHLGLVQAMELPDLAVRLDHWADAYAEHGQPELPAPVEFIPIERETVAPLLRGIHIAVARDTAFSFIYQANLDCLREMGAHVSFFSPLTDTALPHCDALWLPGGYPELHLAVLDANHAMKNAIRAHQTAGKPILAECGGMLYLFESLSDVNGNRANMAGLLPGEAAMQPRLAAIGLQAVDLGAGELRGHSFHYSRAQTELTPLARGRSPKGGATAEAVYRMGRLTASYIHAYFPSNPEAAAVLFSP